MPIIRISQGSPLKIEVFKNKGDADAGKAVCAFSCDCAPGLAGDWKAKKGAQVKDIFGVSTPVAVDIEISPKGGGGGGGSSSEKSY